MNNAPIYDEALLGIHESKLDVDYWPTVMDIHEKGEYKEAILAVLRYIDASILKKYGNKDLTEFAIPHGSIVIYLTIKDGWFKVSAPFLELGDQSNLALMRQLTELNFNVLVLTQIVLKENKLVFEYSCPLEITYPYKIYDIFREICNNADYYDDTFVEKFGAKSLAEMKVQKFDKAQIDKAWEKYQEYLKESLAYLDYFEGRRIYGFGWDILYLAFMKIDYFMEPQGFMRSEIEKYVNEMNAKLPINELLSKAKANIQKLQSYDRQKFETSMYISEVFVPAKTRADVIAVQNNLRQVYDRAKGEIGSSDYTGATLSLLYGIYNLYFRNDIPKEITKILNSGLKNASQKPWKEAAEQLWKVTSTVMDMKSGN